MQLTTHRGFAPATLTEAMQFSEHLAASTMVPKQYQGKPADILVCVQWGYEIGLAPMQALQNIAVINGKPSVYGDAALALVQASPLCEGIDEHIENEGTPNPVAVCIARRKGRMPVVARFSVEDAKRAGLWGKQGPWQAYPKRMLQMRARGFALRDAFPDVLKGLITAEEAQDYPSEDRQPAKDITPRNPLDAISAPSRALPSVSEPERALSSVTEPPRVEQTSDPIVIEQVFAADQAADDAAADQAEADAEREAIIAESGEPPAEAAPGGFPIWVPGKETPLAVYKTLIEWAEAYDALGDKTARAGRAGARTRMTKLRELRECNEELLQRVDLVRKTALMANYSQRLAALGAALTPEEREAEAESRKGG
jgi:hypothetical protein